MSIPTQINPLGIYHQPPFQIKVSIIDAPQTIDLTQDNGVDNSKILKNWGDGTENTNTNHTYNEDGIYTISLTNTSGTVLKSFLPWRSGNVIDCNWKWDSIGEITDNVILNRPYFNVPTWSGKVCTEVPKKTTNLSYFFAHFCNLPCYITSIPDNVVLMDNVGNGNNNAVFIIDKLPPNITTLNRCFRYTNNASKSIINFEKIIENAPLNGFQQLTNITSFCAAAHQIGNTTAAKFLRKCPNVTVVRSGTQTAFDSYYAIEMFGDDDHFECTINIPSDNYTWGFTPTSSAGTWYLIKWGDSSDAPLGASYKFVRGLWTFTSGTKVEHTYSKAGTYTIKLACNADSIVFDPIVSHNQQLQFLGNANGVSFS